MRQRMGAAALIGLLVLAACERKAGCTGEYCGTLVFASTSEPETLLPPVVQSVQARDVSDQVFLKLADLGMLTNTIGDEDFTPLLSDRWEWEGPLTLAFHIDPRARWHDGRRVTAADVVFTYDAYVDPRVGSPYRTSLRWISAVTLRDSLTAVFRFRRRYPEMFYDAVYHMRILPGHLLRNLPRDQWQTAAFGRAPVGDGPYRFVGVEGGREPGARRRLDVLSGTTAHPAPDLAVHARPAGSGHPARGRRGGRHRAAGIARQHQAGAGGAAARDLPL